MVTCGKTMLLCFLSYSLSVILSSHPLSDSGHPCMHHSVGFASENGAAYSRKKINIYLFFSPHSPKDKAVDICFMSHV